MANLAAYLGRFCSAAVPVDWSTNLADSIPNAEQNIAEAFGICHWGYSSISSSSSLTRAIASFRADLPARVAV